jgi:hypothetical protein
MMSQYTDSQRLHFFVSGIPMVDISHLRQLEGSPGTDCTPLAFMRLLLFYLHLLEAADEALRRKRGRLVHDHEGHDGL